MSEQSPRPNFHTLSKERQALREVLKEAKQFGLSPEMTTPLEADRKRLDTEAADFSIPTKEEGGLTRAKELLRADKQEAEAQAGVDERSIREELGPVYGELMSRTERLHDLSDFELRRMREGANNSHAKRVQESLLGQIKKEKVQIQAELSKMERENPTIARATELVELRKGLSEEGHIAHTRTVDGYLDKIGRRMIHGKPMFLHGPTGTGKTSLARYAAQHFTGRTAEMVYCTPQTRDTHIWGKTGIRAEGDKGAIKTVDIYGPLTRAMQDGSIAVFDEFTALPQEQMVFFKGVANAKVGDTITIPGNGEITIAPGFQMIFTANLKSEKNPERQELPPEIAREFEQNNLEVKYTPKEEAYDIMLARLMQSDGSLTMSRYDLATTLPKLCEAMGEIQITYADTTNADTARLVGALDASGRKPGLKKFVMTQGTVEAILESWESERQLSGETSFAEFLDARLATGLTFKEYPEADRILAAKILASKGFLRTQTAESLGLPRDVFNFDAAKQLRGTNGATERLRSESGNEIRLSLKEVAELDSFEVRGRRMAEAAQDLLGEEGPEDQFSADMRKRVGKIFGAENHDVEEAQIENKAFLNKTFEGWYNATDAARAVDKVEALDPTTQDYKALAGDTNQTEFGAYTLNPETQGLDFENLRAFVPDLKAFNGKKVHEVMQHVIDTYGDTHYVPGIEYWKWLIENPGKTPTSTNLKDGKYYFFPGSVLRDKDGDWNVPYARWDGS